MKTFWWRKWNDSFQRKDKSNSAIRQSWSGGEAKFGETANSCRRGSYTHLTGQRYYVKSFGIPKYSVILFFQMRRILSDMRERKEVEETSCNNWARAKGCKWMKRGRATWSAAYQVAEGLVRISRSIGSTEWCRFVELFRRQRCAPRFPSHSFHGWQTMICGDATLRESFLIFM